MQSVIKMSVKHTNTNSLNCRCIVIVIKLVMHTHRILGLKIGHSARNDLGATHTFLDL